ncbi:phage tail tape measure protein, partial [Serratia sp. Ag1]|uniref:phage tail tape measure protein n=1 Tax=Serratia sp. Ag1 TaxID=1524467 RepID=UPI00068F5668
DFVIHYTSIAGESLKASRMELYGQGMETYAVGRTLAAPVVKAVTQYASFESQLRDISVTGDLDARQERAIGTAIRQAALKVNQAQEALLGGVGQLVADGMAPEQASQFAGMLGKTATATKADMTDLAKMTFAFSDALKITDAKELEQAFGMAATGAKLGSFELKDMAKALPGLAKSFAARGIVGKEAITQIVASLEVAKGSGSAEEAVTNMNNWLAAMGRGDTVQKYAKAGIDYQSSMQNYVAQGVSQYEASLMIANRFIDGKGQAFLKQWQAAGAKGDQEGQQKLMESFGLAEVFSDIQTVNHLLSMRQGWDKYLSSKQEMNSPEAKNTISKDADKQNDTLENRWRRTQLSFNDSMLSLGEALRPALIQLADTLIPIIDSAAKWIAANPELVSGTIKLVGALLTFKMATIGLKLGLNLLLSPFVSVWKSAMLLRSNWLLLRTALGDGGRLRWLASGFSRLATGARWLAGIFSGGLFRGITTVGRALLWIGRALLMNPIGIAITVIAGGAYLIYRNWGAISRWFKQRWMEVKEAFNGGIAGVGKLLINWSPLGILYTVFSGALKYLGIDLPAKFTEFGGQMIDGLVNGIKKKWEDVKGAITDMGTGIKDWFAEKLDIHSPSRVFMGFGDNIAQGAVIGLQRSTPLAALAGQRLAQEMTPEVPRIPALDILAAGYAGRGPATAGAGVSSGVTVSFNPQIYLNGRETSAPPDIAKALNLSLRDLEKMLERIVAQQQRRGYN